MVAIPKFGRNKHYILVDTEGNEHDVIIKGYRASDHELVIKLQKYSAELPSLMAKATILKEMQTKFAEQLNEDNFTPEDVEKNFMSMIGNLNDDDYTEDEIQELITSVKNIQELEGEVTKISYQLGQRGLKRFFYKEDPDTVDAYRQAEHSNRLTEYLDGLEDIDVDMDHLQNVANIMIELGMPNRPIGGRGKGKSKK